MSERVFPDPKRANWEVQRVDETWEYFGRNRAAAERCQAATGQMMRYVEYFEVCKRCRSSDLRIVSHAGGGAFAICQKCDNGQ